MSLSASSAACSALEFGDARQQFVDPRQQRLVVFVEIVDLPQQGQHQSLQAFGVERIDLVGRHP
jgi:hypothetical protein